GSHDGLNIFAPDDRVLIRLKRGQFFWGKLPLFQFVCADSLIGNRVSLVGPRCVALAREDSLQGSEHTTLRLASQERRIVLKVERQNHLARQRRILQKS